MEGSQTAVGVVMWIGSDRVCLEPSALSRVVWFRLQQALRTQVKGPVNFLAFGRQDAVASACRVPREVMTRLPKFASDPEIQNAFRK